MFTFFGDHVPGNSFARSQNSSANKWSSNSRRGIERYHLFSITKTVKVLSEGMSSCHSMALVILVITTEVSGGSNNTQEHMPHYL